MKFDRKKSPDISKKADLLYLFLIKKRWLFYPLMQVEFQLLTFGYASSKRFTKKTSNDNRFYLRYKNKNFWSIKCLSLPTIQC